MPGLLHRLGQRLGHRLGHRVGAPTSPTGVWPISYLGHGNPLVTTSTGGSLGKPAGVFAVGDLQVILQLSTSTPTTPTGYTQVLQVASGSFNQILTVWSKTVATSGEASTSVGIGQTTSGLLQGVLLGFRGAKATPVVDLALGTAVVASTTNPQAMQGGTAGAKGYALALNCPTNASGTPTYTASAPWALVQGNVFNNRIAAAVQKCKAGQVLSGTIQSSAFPNGTSMNWNTALLTFK